MLRIALITYSLAILMYSGLSRATEIGIPGFTAQPLKITSVEFSPENFMVRVVGIKPNLCYTTPTPVIAPLQQEDAVWSLQVVANPGNGLCAEARLPFVLVFDIRSLLHNIKDKLGDNDLVTIKVSTTGDLIEIPASQIQSAFAYADVISRGTLSQNDRGQFVLVQKNKPMLRLVGAIGSLDLFVGRNVEVAGIDLVNHLPIVDLTGSGQEFQSPQDELPQLLVTGISASGF